MSFESRCAVKKGMGGVGPCLSRGHGPVGSGYLPPWSVALFRGERWPASPFFLTG